MTNLREQLNARIVGEVVEVGRDNRKLKVGDRVVVPFTISCGECRMCRSGHFSCCERSNPAGTEQAKQTGYPTAGLFDYSHTYGGLPGVFINAVTVPMGVFVGKALTLKTGQTHVQKYLAPLLQRIVAGEIVPHSSSRIGFGSRMDRKRTRRSGIKKRVV